MPKYIDKDWLLAEANMDGAYGYVSADQIAKAPTDNVVEVVRCKDCKYWQDSEVGIVECPICTRIYDMVFEIGADGFCSKGERREESEVEE